MCHTDLIVNTLYVCLLRGQVERSIKSNSHAPNLHACIIYIRVNILPVCIFAHANANTHGSYTYV